MVKIEHADPRSAESQWLIEKLSAELAAITGDGGNSRASVATFQGEGALWVIARDAQGTAVGCGALRRVSPSIAQQTHHNKKPAQVSLSGLLSICLDIKIDI